MSVKKHIPNTITSLNLLCGVIGIWFVFSLENTRMAFLCMLAAVVFDFCDGLAARLLKAYSEIGKELDSLADVVSFGVLPSAMMSVTYGHVAGKQDFLAWIPLMIAVFSALRLARFNVDERQHESFIGLPTPSCALVCASMCCLIEGEGTVGPIVGSWWFIPLVSVILCYLLVSGIPMFSFKFGVGHKSDTVTKMKRTAFFSISAIVIIVVVLLSFPWPAIILGVLLAYILENALSAVFKI